MAKEKENYHEHLARLSKRFPGREAITVPEAAALLGRCTRTVREDKTLPKVRLNREYLIPLVGFARWLS